MKNGVYWRWPKEFPELSCRQLSAWLTDNEGFAVSESTVYRILKREGLVKRQEMEIPAAKEYHTKTTRPHQMWATDASYFKVVGWGYYYLVTVMDDYSRFILACKLQKDMSANSFIEVVQEAVDATGMTDVPVENRTRLLSDNGAGYISRAFRDYLTLVGIRHILAAPFHPQTNGKVERYQQSLKRVVNQLPYELPSQLEQAIAHLPEGCRTVLLLRKIELLSHREISARLGIAVSTVEKQHARALRLLRTALSAGTAPTASLPLSQPETRP